MITKNVNVYLGAGYPVRIPVSQYDTMWTFVFTIINNSTEWTIPQDSSVVINGLKPDGNVFSFSGTIINNKVVVDSDIQMTAVAGHTICELIILSEGKTVGTANFILDVEAAPKSPDDISSESTLPAYGEILDQITEMEQGGAFSGDNILFNGRPSVEGTISNNGDSNWGFYRGDQSENIEIIPTDGFKFTIPSGVSAENARFQLQKYLIYPNKVFPYLAGEFLALNGGDAISASLEIKTPIKLAEISCYFSGKDGNSENLEKAYFFNVEQNSTNNEWVTISGSVTVPTWWDNAKQQINTSRAGIIFVIRADTTSFDATQQHIIWVRNIQISKGSIIGYYNYSSADIDYIVSLGGGGSIVVDSALSSSSENPVQNKAIYSALSEKYVKPNGGIPASDIASGVIPTVPSVYTSTPSALGTASAGSSNKWARGDHIHAMPTAADVGAIPLPGRPSTGAFLVWDGSAWVGQTVPTANGVNF